MLRSTGEMFRLVNFSGWWIVWASVCGALNVETPLNGSHAAEFTEELYLGLIWSRLITSSFARSQLPWLPMMEASTVTSW